MAIVVTVNMAKLKYLETTITKQNYIHKDKTRLNFGNSCYSSVQFRIFYGPISHLKIQRLNMQNYSFIFCLIWVSNLVSLTRREEHRLRVLEKKVLRRMFGPKKEEATGGWRILHIEEFLNTYSSPNIIRMIK
jgi:hypothetical protein